MTRRPRAAPPAAPVALEIANAIDDREARRRDRALALAAQLEAGAEETGNNMLRHAAALVRAQRSPGAPPIDDDAAVAEILERRAAGDRKAVTVVAKRIAERDGANMKSVRRRLGRKVGHTLSVLQTRVAR
jgi:hypothetical protein